MVVTVTLNAAPLREGRLRFLVLYRTLGVWRTKNGLEIMRVHKCVCVVDG